MPLLSPLTPAGQPAADRTRGADGAAREALGVQFGGLWLDTARQGLTVSLRDGRTTTQTFTYRRCG